MLTDVRNCVQSSQWQFGNCKVELENLAGCCPFTENIIKVAKRLIPRDDVIKSNTPTIFRDLMLSLAAI